MRARTEIGTSFTDLTPPARRELLHPTAMIALVFLLIYLVVPHFKEFGQLFGGSPVDRGIGLDGMLSSPAGLVDLIFTKFLGEAVAIILIVSLLRWWRLLMVEPASRRESRAHAVLPVVTAAVYLFSLILVMLAVPASGATMMALMIFVMVLAIFVEEFVWRGIVLVGLRGSGFPEWSVWLLTSLGFSLFHLTNLFAGMSLSDVLSQMVFTFFLGSTCYLARRVGGIWLAVAIHFFNNTMQTCAGLMEDTWMLPLITAVSTIGSILQYLSVPATILLLILDAMRRKKQVATAA